MSNKFNIAPLPAEPPTFSLGKLYTTISVNNQMSKSGKFALEVVSALKQYTACEWGDLSDNDKKRNDHAAKSGNGMILAAYKTTEGRIYIKTDEDRSQTVVMFCDEI